MQFIRSFDAGSHSLDQFFWIRMNVVLIVVVVAIAVCIWSKSKNINAFIQSNFKDKYHNQALIVKYPMKPVE